MSQERHYRHAPRIRGLGGNLHRWQIRGRRRVLTLYLFRHAESVRNLNRKLLIGSGPPGVELSPRAVQTGRIVCEKLGVSADRLVQSDRLNELWQGDWEGGSRPKLYTTEVLERMRSDPWGYKAPNGESLQEVEARAFAWVESILPADAGGDRRLGLFTHGMVIKCLLRKTQGIAPSEVYRINIDNASVTELRFVAQGHHQGWHLVRVNDRAHLMGQIGFEPAGYA